MSRCPIPAIAESELLAHAGVSRAFIVAWKTPMMAAHAYSCYRMRANAEARLARFRREFPTGVSQMRETDLPEDSTIFCDGPI